MGIKWKGLDNTLKAKIENVPRRQLHVCKSDAGNLDYLYDSVPRGQLFHTINDATSGLRPYDDIIVWPGEWTEAATINLNQEGVRLRSYAMGHGPGMAGVELWQYAGTNTPVVTVAAKNVEICGLQILPYNDVSAVGISVGTAVESKYCYIHDNYLRAVAGENMPTLISIGTASTYDAQMCMIENNYFRQGGSSTGASAQIYLGQGTGTTIRNNNFLLAGQNTNYKSVDLGTAIVQRIIVQDNLFMAFEVGGVQFINVGTGSTTDGHLYANGNVFIGATANANCFTWNADNAGLNYLGHNAISS